MAAPLVEGRKDDSEKLRADLLPPDVLMEVSAVLTFGAKKYAPRNWEKGISYGRVIGGALRHIFAIMRGEDRDVETGLLHSAHAICCLMFLCGYQLRAMHSFDDRNKLSEPLWQAGFQSTEEVVVEAALDDAFKAGKQEEPWRGFKI